MITKFDKPSLAKLRKEIDAALAEVSRRNGVAIKMGNIRYTESTFSGKLEAAVASGASTGETVDPRMVKYANDYKRYAGIHGLPIALLNNGTVQFNGKRFTILGYNTRGKTYPIIARNSADQKVYKLPLAAVQSV